MDNQLESLCEIYPYDPQTRTFTILARVGRYDDFFNPLDPSQAPARDLAPDLVEYLNQCSDEIPLKYPVILSLQVKMNAQEKQREQECLASLQTFYRHEIFVSQAEIRRKRGGSLKYLLIAFSCLAVSSLSGQLYLEGFFWNLLREAALIGGWLFTWEAVTLNFIEMDKHYQEIKKYKRLIGASLGFTYDQNPE
jgi:hypothetical protein